MGVWSPVPGFEELYGVSDQGEVRSLDRTDRMGRLRSGRVLKQNAVSRGYLRVTLCDSSGQRRHVYVHHLVLEAFRGPRPPGMEACHYDDDPTNNRLENLRWGTRTENRLDAIRNGRQYGTNMSAKTRCPAGHPYNESNTYEYRRPTGQRNRQCRECHRVRAQRRRKEAQ